MTGVAIVIPMLNEAAGLPRLLRSLAALDPPPAEVLAVDGGSADGASATKPWPARRPWPRCCRSSTPRPATSPPFSMRSSGER
jgi:hypothetical protein